MKGVTAVAVLATVVATVNAECPNGCSGQGICGQNDQCSCYQGHRGNSCEQRVCPYGKAWTTTPNGDVNFDGDLYSAAIYRDGSAFTSRSYVVTPESAGGSWEYWPSYAASGEGHFLMECSNMGICDKEVGECVCFAGFEGYACERMSCPGGNTCNGHGRCMTLEQQLDEQNRIDATSIEYTLWDKDQARSCRCDPGYTGVDCMMRECPKGDDPLTKIHQVNDVQVIDIYSTVVTTKLAGGDIGGTFTLTYTSPNGEKFTTDAITLPSEYDGSTAASTTFKAAVESALTSLPNGVIPSVTVTPGYCEKAIAGLYTTDFVASTGAATLTTEFVRCSGMQLSGPLDCENVIFEFGTGVWGAGGVAACTIVAGDTSVTFDAPVSGCATLTYPRCMRMYVQFTDGANSGPQELLTVNTASLTTNSLADNTITATVTKTPELGSSADDYGFFEAGELGIVDETTTSAKVSTVTVTVDGSAATAPAAVYPAGSSIRIWCKTSGDADYVNMGVYQVAATTSDLSAGTTITLTEAINDPSSRCSATTDFMKIDMLTSYIQSDVDFTSTEIANLGVGFVLGSTNIDSAVASQVTYDTSLAMGYILLEGTIDTSATDSITYGAMAFKLNGAGTKEAEVCSSRGKCDSETGMCACFKGYTGERCDTQNALWLG